MAGRFARGWGIAKQSTKVIRQDPELMIFPILSSIACLLILASFALPLFVSPEFSTWMTAALDAPKGDPDRQKASMMAAIGGCAFYTVNYFVIVFFNTALAACAIKRFQGGDPTLAYGLKTASARLPQIIGWTLLAATVGIVLRMVSERSQLVGKVVVAVIGTAWTVATYFVVPTLAVEGLGPIAALKRSSHILGQAWGEGLAGNLGLSLINLLLFLPAVGIFAAAIMAGSSSPMILFAGLAICGVYLLIMFAFSSAVRQVFIAGLYIYATEKKVPAGFAAESLEAAFVKK